MHRSDRRWLIALIVVGGLIRLLVAALLVHDSYDVESYRIVSATLRDHPSAVYEASRWPYPGLYFPVIVLAGSFEARSGIDISFWVKLAPIAADLALAWLIYSYLMMRGVRARASLASAALVALGPSFVIVSGYIGHIDSLAILPAALALYLWQRWPDGSRRELAAALLVGIGAGLKTVPLLMVLAFLPAITTWWGRLRFGVVASAVPAVLLLPWIVVNPSSLATLRYAGFPGAGGISLAIQPDLPKAFLTDDRSVRYSAATQMLNDVGPPILLVVLAALGLYLIAKRVEPERAAVLLWLAAFVFLPSFFFQYVLWALPFFLMGGYVAHVAVVQAALLGPSVVFEGRPWRDVPVAWAYAVMMLATYAATIAAFVHQLLAVIRLPRGGSRTAPRSRTDGRFAEGV